VDVADVFLVLVEAADRVAVLNLHMIDIEE